MAQQQIQQQIEQQLRQNWQQLRYGILDQFGQVSAADVDSATSVNDLVARIADKTHHSERYIENRLHQLVGVGGGQGGNLGERFGASQGGQRGNQQNQNQNQNQPFGSQQ
ncbi:hypothetical protein MXD59_07035 [Frankia sp. Ag45/Mut15]|uniref:PE-PGRS family protein n=1 Tax=Frankia umida TaxID=573489 RepID=A0ABT0JW31_9ACTN|nr:hypothetical protein [Frankia umida]MCK9875529.1 hypothetical protein [Frankia umida]